MSSAADVTRRGCDDGGRSDVDHAREPGADGRASSPVTWSSAVGTHPVDSVADLQERLYTVAAGHRRAAARARGGQDDVVTVTLADSPNG